MTCFETKIFRFILQTIVRVSSWQPLCSEAQRLLILKWQADDAFAHGSVAIRDCLRGCPGPFSELHRRSGKMAWGYGGMVEYLGASLCALYIRVNLYGWNLYMRKNVLAISLRSCDSICRSSKTCTHGHRDVPCVRWEKQLYWQNEIWISLDLLWWD